MGYNINLVNEPVFIIRKPVSDRWHTRVVLPAYHSISVSIQTSKSLMAMNVIDSDSYKFRVTVSIKYIY